MTKLDKTWTQIAGKARKLLATAKWADLKSDDVDNLQDCSSIVGRSFPGVEARVERMLGDSSLFWAEVYDLCKEIVEEREAAV